MTTTTMTTTSNTNRQLARTVVESPIGELTLLASHDAVVAIRFGNELVGPHLAPPHLTQGVVDVRPGEHALLDDSGDKEGTATPTVDGKEGRVAALMSLGTAGQGDPLPSDPKLRALHEERRALERRVESLRLMKVSMDAQKYTAELEQLVTDLALKTREIRAAEGRK